MWIICGKIWWKVKKVDIVDKKDNNINYPQLINIKKAFVYGFFLMSEKIDKKNEKKVKNILV